MTPTPKSLADPEPKVRLEAVYSCIGCSGLWAITLPALPQITPLYSDPDPPGHITGANALRASLSTPLGRFTRYASPLV